MKNQLRIYETIRRFLKPRYSKLDYTPVVFKAPVIVHRINRDITISIGYCKFPEIDSTAYFHSKGFGYTYILNSLYIEVDITNV